MIRCISYGWSPGAYDPGPSGWLMLLLYLTAAALCYSRMVKASSSQSGRILADERYFWLTASIAIALAAVGKEVSLPEAVSAVGRCLAVSQGWYEERRGVQEALIVCVLALGAVAFGAALWATGRELRRLWAPIAGLLILFIFALARSTSLHEMDVLIGARLLGLKITWIVQIVALGFIIAGTRRKGSRSSGATPRFSVPLDRS